MKTTWTCVLAFNILIINIHFIFDEHYVPYLYQGLTQTFMSSGPQDHQLRGSGDPTIFSSRRHRR